LHKPPTLRRQVLAPRIIFDVTDRPANILRRIQKYLPLAASKRLRWAALVAPIYAMSGNYQMNMLWQDCTS
jgi:hypothetical protein